MAKQTTSFCCTECNYQTIKWIGCCPECKEWNSLVEKKPVSALKKTTTQSLASFSTLSTIDQQEMPRYLTSIDEWDRVMGGGIMPNALIVLTGDPGIGKSTLLLQVCNKLAQRHRTFYISTEESLQQVKQRAVRLKCVTEKLFFCDTADLPTIINTITENRPDILVIDSIQNCYISNSQTIPGSISQLRESTFQLMRLAKEEKITIIITSHITKEGVMAGPKTLEHMVDAVFYLQGEDRWQTRILRAVKNRFGPIHELGFFEMHTDGLQEVSNINEQLLKDVSHAPGSALTSVMEGSRPLLLELQALTIATKHTMPQRVITGLDHKQVILIAAILEKYLQVKLSAHDIFFKISGGLKIKGSISDLAIACALLSSYFQKPLKKQSLILGEISLTGAIKSVNHIMPFIKEAEKFGILQALIAKNQQLDKTTCSILKVSHVFELLTLFEE